MSINPRPIHGRGLFLSPALKLVRPFLLPIAPSPAIMPPGWSLTSPNPRLQTTQINNLDPALAALSSFSC
jgi:hypothetical protein